MSMHLSSPIPGGCLVVVPISSLRPAESPRLLGEDAEHVQALAGVISTLPPIIVHRPTMRVVDGMHRLRAAIQRGQETIEVRLFDGTEKEAFVLSVMENIKHGLPLSLADRKAAAARIVADYPEWADRAVATLVGLAPSSVGAIRQRSTERIGQVNSRIGKDGRARPVDAAARRQRVSELLATHPDASLRQIAKEANVSVGTAHAVRNRMLRVGDGSAPLSSHARGQDQEQPRSVPRSPHDGRAGAEPLNWASLRQQLRADPALRYTESGRRLLHWLDAHAMSPDEWSSVAESIPPYWLTPLENLAGRFSREWQVFAEKLRRKNEMEQDG